MKIFPQYTSAATAAALALCVATTAHAVSFDYSNQPSASISFNGASGFSFVGATNNLKVTSGTANTLLGEITGAYTIGAVVTNGLTSTAPVTGAGTFVIHDGAFNLTANLNWVDISQTGTSGGLNTFGAINLTSITYGGTNPDLVALRNSVVGNNVLSFQFVPAMSLANLKTTQVSTSFSGSVFGSASSTGTGVPDGGSASMMLGAALLGLAIIHRKVRGSM